MAEILEIPCPEIHGYEKEAIQYVIDELTNGTDVMTLEIFLFKKFGFSEEKSDDLLAKLIPLGIRCDIEHIQQNRPTLFKKIMINKYGEERTNEMFKKAEREMNNSINEEAGNSLIMGVVIFVIGVFLTMATGGQRLFYGAILVGIAKFGMGVYYLFVKKKLDY